MNIIDYIKNINNRLKFLKWIEIIHSENSATKNSAMYLLEDDADGFNIVVIDDSGKKRKCIGVPKPNTTGTYTLKSINGVLDWQTALGIYGDILSFPTFADFPLVGEVSKIYKANDTDKIYVWDAEGSEYLESGIANGGGGGTQPADSYIEITKSQLDTHVTNSTLEPGVLYGIKECERWMLLGDSTDTLFLRAVSTNQLETKGIGKFFVPKYDQSVDGYGIWKGEVYEAFPTTVPEPNYVIGDKVIWGGRLWNNVSGNLGTKANIYTLSSDWEAIPFNETDYNVRFDKIEYDYQNDMVIYRKDDNGNEVSTSYEDWYFKESIFDGNPLNISLWNSLKIYQWGNEFKNEIGKGCGFNIIINSILECLNTCGVIISNTLNNGQINSNTLNNDGSIFLNILENNGQIKSNTLNNGQIMYNTLKNDGGINSNTLNGGTIDYNTLNYGSIRSNTLNGGTIRSNTLENYGYINSNTLNNDGNIVSNTLEDNGEIVSNTLESNGSINSNTLKKSGDINSNTLNNYGSIVYNTLNGGTIRSNTLENYGYINSNTLNNDGQIRLGLTNTINIKKIQYLTINGGDIGGDTGIDLSSATLVYADFTREVFKNSAGVSKIRYFNENDVMVIADLTD